MFAFLKRRRAARAHAVLVRAGAAAAVARRDWAASDHQTRPRQVVDVHRPALNRLP